MLKKVVQTFVRFFLWIALLCIRGLVTLIPNWARPKIGGGLGAGAYWILKREREKTLRHLNNALGAEKPPSELNQIGRDCFRNLGRNALDVVRLDRIKNPEFEKTVKLEGKEILKKAMESGRGVIFITGHIGNWELMAAFIARDYPVAVVAAPIYDTRIENLMIRLRQVHGIETFVRDSPGSLKKILRFLKKGGMLGILIDQDTRTGGIHVPFFNQMAYTTNGAANIALRTGASVVAGFISRTGGNSHQINIQGPLSLQQTKDPDSDLKENTALFTRLIEEQVRKTPDQWVWMHRRWRTPLPENSAA